MVLGLVKKIFGTQNDRELRRMGKTVKLINELEPDMEAKSDQELKEVTTVLRKPNLELSLRVISIMKLPMGKTCI